MSRIQCHPSMLQRFLASCSKPSGAMRRLVRKRCFALNGLPSRVPVVTTSTIQLVPTHSWRLTLDLAIQGSLVGLDRQEEVDALLLEPLKNGFWVCRASALMSRPWRSNSP